jgi:hypothetical protein
MDAVKGKTGTEKYYESSSFIRDLTPILFP